MFWIIEVESLTRNVFLNVQKAKAVGYAKVSLNATKKIQRLSLEI